MKYVEVVQVGKLPKNVEYCQEVKIKLQNDLELIEGLADIYEPCIC